MTALIRCWLLIAVLSLPTVVLSQQEWGVVLGGGGNDAWRTRPAERGNEFVVDAGPFISFGLSFADRISSGAKTWMRADVLYSKYRIEIQERNESRCCSSFDSATIDLQLATVRLGPEFEIAQNTRLFIPVDLSWPLSSRAAGSRRSFIPPTTNTQGTYTNERSNYGKFNVSIGAGVSFSIPVSSAYTLAAGPLLSLSLFNNSGTSSDIRLYHYALFLSVRRRAITPPIPQH